MTNDIDSSQKKDQIFLLAEFGSESYKTEISC